MRIDVGSGYRIYLGQDGKSLVILLCGGTKATQGADIANAKRYWQDYRSRKDAEKRTIR
jgi:putative addiction module killer protein